MAFSSDPLGVESTAIFALKALCDTEINEFELKLFINDEVLEFYVSVSITTFMALINGVQHLFEEISSHWIAEPLRFPQIAIKVLVLLNAMNKAFRSLVSPA